MGSVGCKLTAAVHFSPASWPIAMAMSRRIRQKLSSLGPIFASTPQARQAPNPSLSLGSATSNEINKLERLSDAYGTTFCVYPLAVEPACAAGSDQHVTQFAELVLQAALAHCRQRSVLHAHAARVDQLQRVQIDLLVAGKLARFNARVGGRRGGSRGSSRSACRLGRPGPCWGSSGCAQAWHGTLARNDLGCKALREGLHLLRQRCRQHRLLARAPIRRRAGPARANALGAGRSGCPG